MSRKIKTNITKKVMAKVKKGQVKMKPRILFILGSILLVLGIFGTLVILLFGVSVISLSLRANAPMFMEMKYLWILRRIPWWAFLLSIVGIISSFLLLKNYDFSYKKNFAWILLATLLSTILLGIVFNFINLDRKLFGKGPMRRFYQQEMYKNLPGGNPLRIGPGQRHINFKRY